MTLPFRLILHWIRLRFKLNSKSLLKFYTIYGHLYHDCKKSYLQFYGLSFDMHNNSVFICCHDYFFKAFRGNNQKEYKIDKLLLPKVSRDGYPALGF
jgi:hypothetical protein